MSEKLYIAGIGASAGGLDPIQKLFDSLPNNTGMAFVIVQHLSPDFKSLMPELLSKHTKMKIYTATDKMEVKPNCVYLNPRDKNLHIKGNMLFLLDKGPKRNLNLPIDIFFHTLGEEKKEESIGVVLSGTGSDGSRGIRTIKEGGGTILVQSPDSAQFDGMPNAAISTNLVDFTLDPKKIAELLAKYSESLPRLGSIPSMVEEDDELYGKILEELKRVTDIDFKNYKSNTLLRRIEKRMTLNNIDTLEQFYEFLATNAKEAQALQQDFLIGVTSFFRDKPAFESLRDKVIPNLFSKHKDDDQPIRVWVSGCSTGEEVYSLAILMEEHIRLNKLSTQYKLFATDIDVRALPVASAGVYSINPETELLSSDYLRYFDDHQDRMRIKKRIRDNVVFSKHNLLTSPPFIRMDLVVCRNLLIYLNSAVQQKVYNNFKFALNKFGYLFLGNSESLGASAKDFKVIDSKWKIFQNLADSRYVNQPTDQNGGFKVESGGYDGTGILDKSNSTDQSEFEFLKILASRFSPDCIFFDSDYEVLFINGKAGQKLTLNSGMFQRNLLKMVSTQIGAVIRSSVNKLKDSDSDVLVKGVRKQTDGGDTTEFDLKFSQVKRTRSKKDLYLIQFTVEKTIEAEVLEVKELSLDQSARQYIEELETKLKASQAELQNVVEELETSNEELQSSNEELMSSNEELQSTNEELQSVNEELYSVNAELQERNRDLATVSNDLTNLLNSTDIGTLFLDLKLNIRKFTPSLKRHFKLHSNDIGRPITSFVSNFDESTRKQLLHEAQDTLENLTNNEQEIVDNEGARFLLRTSPFITNDRKIEGVVITFVDVTKLKQAENKLSEAEERYRLLFEHLNEGFVHAKIITDDKGEPVDWEYLEVNSAFEKLLGVKKDFLINKRVSNVLPDVLKDPNKWLLKYAHTALTGEEQLIQEYLEPLDKFLVVHVFSPAKGEFAATFADLTEMKTKEEALQRSNQRLELATRLTGLALWEWNIINNSVEGNERWKTIFGLPEENVLEAWGKNMEIPEQEQANVALEDYLAGKTELYLDSYHYIHPETGKKLWIRNLGKIIEYDKDGNPKKMLGVSIDETDRYASKQRLIKATLKAESANIHKNQFLANMSHEIRTPMNGIVGFSNLLKNPELDEATKQSYAEIIESNSAQLLNLMDDIIDVSKLEAGEIRIEKGAVDLRKLMTNLHTNYLELRKQRGKEHVELELNVPEKFSFNLLETDEKRLNQVLVNLLNNALKFTDEGAVRFGVKEKDEKLQFYVSDDGIGIPEDKLAEIFERFKQVTYNSAKYGGTGLGLSISKGFVDILGGKFQVESKKGEGSTFSFTLPINESNIEEATTAKSNVSESINLKNCTILVVDDTQVNHLYLNALLKPTGANLLSAKTGEEAIEVFKRQPDDINLVLMDIRMPGINGYDAMQEILQIKPHANVIMQSAHAMQEEKEKCTKLGGKAYLVKPIDKMELLTTLDSILNEKSDS